MQQPTRRQLYLGVIVAFVLCAYVATSAFAAPPAQGVCQIAAPQSGATLSGVVQIEGTASLGPAGFSFYVLAVAPNGTEAWGDLGQVREPVVNGQLGVWDSAAVPDGVYQIRLRVVDPTANYCEAIVPNLQVRNTNPPTPTPAETPTPEETEAPPIQNAVPTPLPTIASPGETETPGPTATLVRPGPTNTPGDSSLLPGVDSSSIIDAVLGFVNSIVRTFLFGILAMAGVLFLVGVIFFVRRVL